MDSPDSIRPDSIRAEVIGKIEAAETLAALEEIRIAELGKKGRVSGLMKSLGGMDPETRKAEGPALNGLRDAISDSLAARKAVLENAALNERLLSETLDLTLPVLTPRRGTIHPVSQVMDEVTEIFADLGFAVAEGPDIEDDFHNFTALNIPETHPARQMHDTFYLPPDAEGRRKVLRTHTSPVQIRTMMREKPPIRIIAPGRTYRSDSDATHTPMFHQIEGLVIDTETHLGHLKGTLEAFCKAFFGLSSVRMRFRPSYFPFTEPSMEVDIGCAFREGELVIGEGDGWLEILGCGMVHRNVFLACGLDPDIYQGWAFGCGIDRLAMLKYGMNDLRAFFESDQRWLEHYGFNPLSIPTIAGGLNP